MLCAFQQWYVEHKAAADGALLALCAPFALAAQRLYRSRPRAAAACLGLCGSAVALALATDDYLHPWDEQFHALVAKNLTLHPLMPTLYEVPLLPSSGYWDSTHVWLFHPPGPLWLMSASYALFGPCQLALRLPSVLAHGVATAALFVAGSRLFRPEVGGWAAFLFAINGKLLELAAGRAVGDHPNSLFTSLVTIAIALAAVQHDAPKPWRPPLIGFITGLAVLTKWLPALLVLGLWALLLYGRGALRARFAELVVGALAAAAVVVPWEIYAVMQYPADHALFLASNWSHVVEVLDEHAGGPFFHLTRVPATYGELCALAVAWFVWARAWRARDTAALVAVVWFAVPYFFFAFVRTKMANHVMFASGGLCLIIAYCIGEAWATRASSRGWRRHVLLGLCAVWVLLPVRYAVERWKPFTRNESERALAAELRALPGSDTSRVALFGSQCRCAPAAMFYSGQVAYPFEPDAAQRAELEAKGFGIGTLPRHSRH